MASFSTLTDTFDTIDTAKWNNWGSLTATGGKATITNGISDTNYHGIDSKTTYDLTGTAVKIEIVDAGNQSLTSLAVYPFQLTLDANNRLFWGIYNGTLQATKQVAGVNTSLYSTTYSTTTHRWVRIREASGTIYYDTSADGTTWTNRASVANPFAVTSLSLSILAGTWQNEASATTIQLDNLNAGGGITTSTPTKSKSLAFGGTTYVEAPSSGIALGTDDFYISFFVRVNSTTGVQTILAKYEGASYVNNPSGRGFEFLYRGDFAGKTIQFRVNDGSSEGQIFDFSTNFTDGKTHHIFVAFQKSGSKTVRGYVDGEMKFSTTAVKLGSFTNTGVFRIGRQSGTGTGSYFIGTVFDVAIGKVTLSSDSQMDLLAKKAYKSRQYEGTLVADYLLREGTGTTAIDLSPSANNGTIYNGVWVAETSLLWKGYRWDKRLTSSATGNPGFGTWSEENVWIDENGYLIMRLSNPTGNAPIGAEITNKTAGLGYGTYTITVDKDFTGIHKNLVFGGLFPMFYGNPYVEIDVNEVSKWEGSTARIGHTTWYGSDPDNPLSHTSEVDVPSDAVQTHRLIWTPTKLTIDSFVGSDTSGTPYFHTVYTEDVPVPNQEVMMMNIWAYADGTPTSDDTNIPETLVTVRDLTYTTDIPLGTPNTTNFFQFI